MSDLGVRSYEYRSRSMWGGVPIVHVAIGRRDASGRYRPARARGLVAVGDVAQGLVAVGGVAVGLVSIGGVAVGLLGVGAVAVALLAVGAVSVGVLAVGAVAVGVATTGALMVGADPLRAAAALTALTWRR